MKCANGNSKMVKITDLQTFLIVCMLKHCPCFGHNVTKQLELYVFVDRKHGLVITRLTVDTVCQRNVKVFALLNISIRF